MPLLTLLVLLLALAGCTKLPQSPLRVATNTWVGYSPLYLARTQGMFAEQDVRLVEMLSAADVLHALRNDLVEAAAMTLDEALLLRATGFDVRVVMLLDVSNGADVLIARPAIQSLAQLRGHRIGYENTAVGAVILDAALQAGRLQRQDVVLVPMAANEQAAAFAEGRIDAVVTFEPMAGVMRQAGGRVLFSSADIPDKIVDVLVVHGDPDSYELDNLQRVMRGWFNAVDYAQLNPQGAYSIMGRRYGISGEEMRSRMNGLQLITEGKNRELLLGRPSPLTANIAQLAETMKMNGLLPQVPNLRRMVTTYPLSTL